jgi:hypothetical protein
MPVAPLALFRLGPRRFLLLGPIATLHLGGGAIRTAGIETTLARRAEAARGTAWSCGWRPTGTRSRETTRTRSTRARRTAWSDRWARTTGTWRAGRRPGLGFLDDEGTALHQPAGQLFDGLLGASFGLRFDESEPTRAPRFAIHRDADTANLDLLGLENLFQLLFVDVVGEVPYE